MLEGVGCLATPGAPPVFDPPEVVVASSPELVPGRGTSASSWRRAKSGFTIKPVSSAHLRR
jgi:hypothetical protein